MNLSKISIIMAYRERPQLLINTLQSYLLFYSDILHQLEIVLIDDTPYDNHAHKILDESRIPFQYHKYNRSIDKYRNPGPVYNRGVEKAKYDILHLTNPENIHLGPVLKHSLDFIANNNYIVYGCRTLKSVPVDLHHLISNPDDYTNWNDADGWYQHTKIDNRLLHFASVISKELYQSIGGFDHRYENGIGFEDNDFIETLIQKNTKILAFDEPAVAHQFHDRGYLSDRYEGFEKNKQIYLDKWGIPPSIHREGW